MKKALLAAQVLGICNLFGQEEVAISPSNRMFPKQNEESCILFKPGDDPLLDSTGTFNYPANVDLDCGYDVYADLAYLYWTVGEGGLDLATAGYAVDEHFNPAAKDGFVVFQDFKFTSGFKASLGTVFGCDLWTLDLTYTYFREETKINSGKLPSPFLGFAIFNMAPWFWAISPGGSGVGSTKFTSEWSLDLDWLDLTLQRPFYQGKKVVVTPIVGLRGSWIKQNLTLSTNSAQFLFFGFPLETDVSSNRSRSWAVGPRALVNAHWLISKGLRLQGNIGGSLLYTRFTKIAHSETGSDDLVIYPASAKITDYNCIRPTMEANIGLGWGEYFNQNRYHLDLSITYDFNYLWGQNMMRYLSDVYQGTVGAYPNDLFLHGLDVSLRFDF